MATRKNRLRNSRKTATAGQETGHRLVIYVHGIGAQPAPDVLKRDWDLALFGKEMGDQPRMAYWADILHANQPTSRTRAVRSETGIDIDALLHEAGVAANNDNVLRFSRALASRLGIHATGTSGIRADGGSAACGSAAEASTGWRDFLNTPLFPH